MPRRGHAPLGRWRRCVVRPHGSHGPHSVWCRRPALVVAGRQSNLRREQRGLPGLDGVGTTRGDRDWHDQPCRWPPSTTSMWDARDAAATDYPSAGRRGPKQAVSRGRRRGPPRPLLGLARARAGPPGVVEARETVRAPASEDDHADGTLTAPNQNGACTCGVGGLAEQLERDVGADGAAAEADEGVRRGGDRALDGGGPHHRLGDQGVVVADEGTREHDADVTTVALSAQIAIIAGRR